MCYVFYTALIFFEKVNDDHVEDMRCIKRQSFIEFGDYKIITMVYALDTIDEMIVLKITIELKGLLEKSNCSREKTYYLINFEQFVDTATKQVNEH